jgi:hemerythrin superfamily protein
MDAITLLKEDHRKVEKLFKEIEEAPPGKREQLFNEINKELRVHAELEEKLFYPAADEAKPTHELALEAVEEHKQVKMVLADLEKSDKKTETWLAGVKVLKEDVLHHVKEEETELFPKIRKEVLSEQQLTELGQRMQAMKMELMATLKL